MTRARIGRVVVVGTVNMDTVVSVDTFALPGETRIASTMQELLGGKGLAQSIAAARFGSSSTLIAAVGDDPNATAARGAMRDAGVDDSLLRTVQVPTGRAIVTVSADGENSIVVNRGANGALIGLTEVDLASIASADVVLAQLEAGPEICGLAIDRAHESGVTVMLNAAPAAVLAAELLARVDVLIVNEIECEQLGGSARLAALAKAVVVTLGAAGAVLYRDGSAPLALPALAVTPVDTTGAGDTFCGVFAAAVAQGSTLVEALQFALAAGSLATLRSGNVPAIPDRGAVLSAQLGQIPT